MKGFDFDQNLRILGTYLVDSEQNLKTFHFARITAISKDSVQLSHGAWVDLEFGAKKTSAFVEPAILNNGGNFRDYLHNRSTGAITVQLQNLNPFSKAST